MDRGRHANVVAWSSFRGPRLTGIAQIAAVSSQTAVPGLVATTAAPAFVRRVENTRFPVLFSWIARSAARRLRTCVPLPRLRPVFPRLRALVKTCTVALASGRASILRGSFSSWGRQPAQREREQHHYDTQRRRSGSEQNWDYSQHCRSPCIASATPPARQ